MFLYFIQHADSEACANLTPRRLLCTCQLQRVALKKTLAEVIAVLQSVCSRVHRDSIKFWSKYSWPEANRFM